MFSLSESSKSGLEFVPKSCGVTRTQPLRRHLQPVQSSYSETLSQAGCFPAKAALRVSWQAASVATCCLVTPLCQFNGL